MTAPHICHTPKPESLPLFQDPSPINVEYFINQLIADFLSVTHRAFGHPYLLVESPPESGLIAGEYTPLPQTLYIRIPMPREES